MPLKDHLISNHRLSRIRVINIVTIIAFNYVVLDQIHRILCKLLCLNMHTIFWKNYMWSECYLRKAKFHMINLISRVSSKSNDHTLRFEQHIFGRNFSWLLSREFEKLIYWQYFRHSALCDGTMAPLTRSPIYIYRSGLSDNNLSQFQ